MQNQKPQSKTPKIHLHLPGPGQKQQPLSIEFKVNLTDDQCRHLWWEHHGATDPEVNVQEIIVWLIYDAARRAASHLRECPGEETRSKILWNVTPERLTPYMGPSPAQRPPPPTDPDPQKMNLPNSPRPHAIHAPPPLAGKFPLE